MRWANFIEGLFFMVGFLVVCLVVMTSRPLQPLPARKTVPVIHVAECAPHTIHKSTGWKSDHGERLVSLLRPRLGAGSMAALLISCRRGCRPRRTSRAQSPAAALQPGRPLHNRKTYRRRRLCRSPRLQRRRRNHSAALDRKDAIASECYDRLSLWSCADSARARASIEPFAIPSASASSAHSLSLTMRCVACANQREGIIAERSVIQDHARAGGTRPSRRGCHRGNRHFELQQQDVVRLKFQRLGIRFGHRAVPARDDCDDVLAAGFDQDQRDAGRPRRPHGQPKGRRLPALRSANARSANSSVPTAPTMRTAAPAAPPQGPDWRPSRRARSRTRCPAPSRPAGEAGRQCRSDRG